MKFEYLEDVATADVAFKAEGKTLNGLFENCGLATAETIANTKTIKEKITKKEVFEEETMEQLLYSFLSEIIFLKDAESLFFSRFEVKIEGKKAFVQMHGSELNKKMELRNDVKAVTMYLLKIEQTSNKYNATVVLDI